MRLQRVYPFPGLSVTSRRGFRGRHLFFVLLCKKALRRREGEERARETQKEGNFLSLCVGKFLPLRIRALGLCVRVAFSSIDGDAMLIVAFGSPRSVY